MHGYALAVPEMYFVMSLLTLVPSIHSTPFYGSKISGYFKELIASMDWPTFFLKKVLDSINQLKLICPFVGKL